MPRVNIWIRNEDWDRWQAITNKPEWLHGVMVAEDLGKTLYPMPKGKDLSELFKGVEIDNGTNTTTYTPPEDTA